MITLFIDTSSSDVSIAILRGDDLVYSITKSIPNKHSIYTVSFIEEAISKSNLEPKDINQIMVVNGPGSFTGLRIGVTIAKTYAYLNNIKIIPVSALKMLSLSIDHEFCLSLIDAHHDNYYIGLYDKDNIEVIEEEFNSVDRVLELIDKYNPTVVSCDNINNSIKVDKVDIDISNIYSFYKDKVAINAHLLVPDYLKLPQALEGKND
ncbi:tRNA (adenosine(37)-N6)-threonylcarbamoyltransferase complex dimerization subunit type 1 TsaB [Segatella bryantii]|uniref:tRNA (adenosine(37)-N6)-threonylcarbamoyltransferase complex dimerization subunit type 1 TsaB n=1 Tax=Segatella bryantii TaxID=77095 RepID=UPI00241FB217|nr:tRNA (adenosine(37)-N6)-threonylcarbamoyltransferase complex dimerization subunit type 1 TsaB [Segatella bryantii]